MCGSHKIVLALILEGILTALADLYIGYSSMQGEDLNFILILYSVPSPGPTLVASNYGNLDVRKLKHDILIQSPDAMVEGPH